MQVVLCVQASDMTGNQINKYKNLPGPEFPCQKSDAMMKTPQKNLPGPEFPCQKSDAMMKTPQIYQPSLISVLYSVSLGNTFQFKSWIACMGGSGDS